MSFRKRKISNRRSNFGIIYLFLFVFWALFGFLYRHTNLFQNIIDELLFKRILIGFAFLLLLITIFPAISRWIKEPMGVR